MPKEEKRTHTPGPWQAVEVFGTLPYVVAPGSDQVVAERVYNGNQTLIAAAPDLLRVLERFAVEACREDCGDGDCAFCDARRVVRKARGEG